MRPSPTPGLLVRLDTAAVHERQCHGESLPCRMSTPSPFTLLTIPAHHGRGRSSGNPALRQLGSRTSTLSWSRQSLPTTETNDQCSHVRRTVPTLTRSSKPP